MASQGMPVDELERRAEEQRRRLSRDVVELRHNMQRELDVRNRLADGIHSEPGKFYGIAAGVALVVGYLIARILKA
jgi:ElaB/YqjD/DUF883 family membrane-anchored ribosome-binding protein